MHVRLALSAAWYCISIVNAGHDGFPLYHPLSLTTADFISLEFPPMVGMVEGSNPITGGTRESAMGDLGQTMRQLNHDNNRDNMRLHQRGANPWRRSQCQACEDVESFYAAASRHASERDSTSEEGQGSCDQTEKVGNIRQLVMNVGSTQLQANTSSCSTHTTIPAQ